MPQIPFAVSTKETMTAGGTITHTYKAPNNQDFLIHQIFFVIGAAFSLIRVQDDRGTFYTFASQADPIPSTELPQSNTDVTNLKFPAIPLLLHGGTTIEVELLDGGSGGTNTVIFNGELSVPG